MVHLVTAIGLGPREVGADALAEASASLGMFGLTVEDWAQMLGATERGEAPPVDWGLLGRHADVVGPVRRASDEELVRARTVLVGLSGFYALYVMHGLLMPDADPGRAAAPHWRLRHVPVSGPHHRRQPLPTQFTDTLAVCLQSLFDDLYEALMDQIAVGPDLFRVPGEETGAAGFMERGIRTLRERAPAG